jgi:hypothetical protein
VAFVALAGGGGDPETAVLACCTWLTVCRLFVRSTRGRTELSVGLRRTMVKQPTTIKSSGSVRPAHSHIVVVPKRVAATSSEEGRKEELGCCTLSSPAR